MIIYLIFKPFVHVMIEKFGIKIIPEIMSGFLGDKALNHGLYLSETTGYVIIISHTHTLGLGHFIHKTGN